MDWFYARVTSNRRGFSGYNGSVLITPPKPVLKSYYRCDTRFHLDHVLDMYKTETSHGIVMVAGGEVICYQVVRAGDHLDIRKIGELSTVLPKHQRKGGQSSERFRRIREEKEELWVKRVAELIVKTYMRRNHTEMIIDGILLAGGGRMKTRVSRCETFRQYFGNVLLGLDEVADINVNRAVWDVYYRNIDRFTEMDAGVLAEFEAMDRLFRDGDDRVIFGEFELWPMMEEKMLKSVFVDSSLTHVQERIKELNDWGCQVRVIDTALMQTRIGIDIVGIKYY